MDAPQLVVTSAGIVEVLRVPGERPPVLFFPGGHCRAATDCGRSLYTELGHEVISFSRPGYGRTRVGSLDAAGFAPLVAEVCESLGISTVAASVGVSFGGLQAAHVAAARQLWVPRLILHSCAPSSLDYPDSRAQAVLGPLVFSPLLQSAVWLAIRAAIRSDAGLRVVTAQLSNLPIRAWWGSLSAADRSEVRVLFQSMRSDSGFVNDLRQGRSRDADARRRALSAVPCPALVTASPHDGGVSFDHAENFAHVIPDVELIELSSPSHLFWIGPERARLLSVLDSRL